MISIRGGVIKMLVFGGFQFHYKLIKVALTLHLSVLFFWSHVNQHHTK